MRDGFDIHLELPINVAQAAGSDHRHPHVGRRGGRWRFRRAPRQGRSSLAARSGHPTAATQRPRRHAGDRGVQVPTNLTASSETFTAAQHHPGRRHHRAAQEGFFDRIFGSND
ncbi:MAG: hypothetical protein R2838_24785 [Caldilineaceae bacterium]